MKLIRNLQHSVLMAMGVLASVTVFVTWAEEGEQPISIDLESETALLAHVGRIGDGFSLSRSEHFVLVTDLGPLRQSELRLLDRVESTYARVVRFCKRNGLAIQSPRQRLEIVCFAQPADYVRLARAMSPSAERADGFYDYNEKRSYFANRAAGMRGTLVDRTWWIVVRHESFHQVLDHIAPALARAAPEWLSEGLACDFETAVDHGGSDRPVNKWRLMDVARADGVYAARRFTDVIREEWGGLNRANAYARAWVVVSYLSGERNSEFRRYLQQLARVTHAPVPVAPKRDVRLSDFERVFGTVDARMDAAIADHARGLVERNDAVERGSP